MLRKTPTRVAACAPKGVDRRSLRDVRRRRWSTRIRSRFRTTRIEELRLERSGDAGRRQRGEPAVIELARKGTGFHQRAPVDRELTADEAEAASELLTRIAHGAADDVSRGGGAVRGDRARARAVPVSTSETSRSAPPGPDGRTPR